MNITIGYIGLGIIIKSHLDAVRTVPGFQVAWGCDLNPERRDAFSRDTGARVTADYRELLAAAPDVVVVCLPHGLHCPVTVAALEQGCHVLVEKPMATSVAECNQMLAAARRHDRRLLVAEAASFTPGAVRTGEKFKAGLLGRFLTGYAPNIRRYFSDGRAKWFLDPAMSGGGMFANVGLHRLAATRACLPGLSPRWIMASVSQVAGYAVEACTAALVSYAEDGSVLFEEVGYHHRPPWFNPVPHFIFEAGIVSWEETVWRLHSRSEKPVEEPLVPIDVPYVPVYHNLRRAICGETYAPSAGELAVDVSIAQAAYAASRDKRLIDLTDPDWIIHG